MRKDLYYWANLLPESKLFKKGKFWSLEWQWQTIEKGGNGSGLQWAITTVSCLSPSSLTPTVLGYANMVL